MTSGSCLDDPPVAAPCFVTATTAFNLADIVPDVFPVDVGEVEGYGAGTFTGDPITGIVDGTIEGFLPETAVADFNFALGGMVISGTDLLENTPLDIHEGVPGYWVLLRFTAGRTDCNDDNPCTQDMCSPISGVCQYTTAPNGTACDDGFAYTIDDECMAGVCQGKIAQEPTVFRIDSLALAEPAVSYDFGSGPVEVNDLIGAFLTVKLDEFEFGGMVSAFDPLILDYPNSSLLVGEGQCPMELGNWVPCCTLADEGLNTQFGGVQFEQVENCSDDPLIAAPCFVTDNTTFNLSEIIPGMFAGDIFVTGHGAGTFIGDPINGIAGGIIRGFLPQSAVAGLSLEVGGLVVTGPMLLAYTPTETHGDVTGWWVTLEYTAKRDCN